MGHHIRRHKASSKSHKSGITAAQFDQALKTNTAGFVTAKHAEVAQKVALAKMTDDEFTAAQGKIDEQAQAALEKAKPADKEKTKTSLDEQVAKIKKANQDQRDSVKNLDEKGLTDLQESAIKLPSKVKVAQDKDTGALVESDDGQEMDVAEFLAKDTAQKTGQKLDGGLVKWALKTEGGWRTKAEKHAGITKSVSDVWLAEGQRRAGVPMPKDSPNTPLMAEDAAVPPASDVNERLKTANAATDALQERANKFVDDYSTKPELKAQFDATRDKFVARREQFTADDTKAGEDKEAKITSQESYVKDGNSIIDDGESEIKKVLKLSSSTTQAPDPTATPQPSPSPTATPQPSPGPTATPQPSPGPTATPQPSLGPTATPQPSPGPTATPQPSPGPTATPQPSPDPTATPASSTSPVPEKKLTQEQEQQLKQYALMMACAPGKDKTVSAPCTQYGELSTKRQNDLVKQYTAAKTDAEKLKLENDYLDGDKIDLEKSGLLPVFDAARKEITDTRNLLKTELSTTQQIYVQQVPIVPVLDENKKPVTEQRVDSKTNRTVNVPVVEPSRDDEGNLLGYYAKYVKTAKGWEFVQLTDEEKAKFASDADDTKPQFEPKIIQLVDAKGTTKQILNWKKFVDDKQEMTIFTSKDEFDSYLQ